MNQFKVVLSLTILLLIFAAASAQLRVHPSARVTIGTTMPNGDSKLMILGGANRGLLITTNHAVDWWQSSASHVSRALTVSWVVRWNNQDRFWVQGNGTIVAKDAYFWSDASFKQDIRPISSAIERLKKINGVSFSYKPEAACLDCGAVVVNDSIPQRHFGFIAQDVQKVFPEMVGEAPDKKLLVSYQQMIPVLVESIKEQQVEIERLHAEIQWMKENIKMKKSPKTQKR